MDEYLHLKIHHSGEFVHKELIMYEGGKVVDLKVEVDRGSYFELVGCFKELGYSVIEKIYYRDPTFEMNVSIDDKGALEIDDIYRVQLSVDIYIQHTLSHPEYYDGLLDEIEVNHNDIVNESEEVLATMYEEVINGS
ncbi:unnamed protein product [Lathyrus oleraceus]